MTQKSFKHSKILTGAGGAAIAYDRITGNSPGVMFLGVHFNIASYSLLIHIIANITGYKPGRFIHIIGDAHIYESHLDAVKEQISRVPYSFPELVISDELTDINDIKEEYFTVC